MSRVLEVSLEHFILLQSSHPTLLFQLWNERGFIACWILTVYILFLLYFKNDLVIPFSPIFEVLTNGLHKQYYLCWQTHSNIWSIICFNLLNLICDARDINFTLQHLITYYLLKKHNADIIRITSLHQKLHYILWMLEIQKVSTQIHIC